MENTKDEIICISSDDDENIKQVCIYYYKFLAIDIIYFVLFISYNK